MYFSQNKEDLKTAPQAWAARSNSLTTDYSLAYSSDFLEAAQAQ